MKNRIISVLLGFVLAILASGQTFASFPDTINHQYSTAIDWVQADGIVSGYPDGTYGPDNVINRAEFTKIVVGATVGGDITGGYCFPDVTNEWFAPYICTAKDNGIVGGNDDGTFRPANEVNYAEALKIVLEAYNTDFPRISYEFWYSKYVEYALDKGLSFAANKLPHSFITRGEMAEIIYWINNPQADTTSPSTSSTIGNTCTTTLDCNPVPYCVGSQIMMITCEQGVCTETLQVDCPTQGDPVLGNFNCGDTGKGFVECY